ncbi:tryptophan synthase subunit alpha [Helicobacter sp. 11S02629-2]|uniref:tryptophan synthase subunit alpha n=1 Tax=Helicobacter sp. 11S02629-2 TaxID=1476195 RepID=UPI000BA678E5|nr:tryptophan synthase subunit alpha [Helicobacter sp. 11S02629-2]PAF45968.1 tryptophan synthase subunit alpha [Helicobacter sp. 11S02629-2]
MKLMGHMIAGYPDIKSSIDVGRGILEGGASYLEVQFPFSDGNADGILIQNASMESISKGFSPKEGFKIIKTLAGEFPKARILAMTYANIIYAYGIYNFIKDLKEAGGYGLIAPDFLYTKQDHEGIRGICAALDVKFIELVTATSSSARIKEIDSKSNAPLLYVVAREGITGASTDISPALKANLTRIRKLSKKELYVGFGINSKEQVKSLEAFSDGFVVGSYFVKCVDATKGKKSKVKKEVDFISELKEATMSLLN